MRRLISLCETILTEAPVNSISKQHALDNDLFGPLYHGTPNDIGEILSAGFDVERSIPDGRNTPSNGYPFQPYSPGGGVVAPFHHLGFGIYFTTVKGIAKAYNGNSVKGLKEFYIDAPNMLTINFASPRKMMEWWVSNGYDMTIAETMARDRAAWVRSTKNMTKSLSDRYDAVWFKGKSMTKLLDGDQVCVYDPARIYVVDPSKSSGMEVGSKVFHNQSIPKQFQNDHYLVDDLKQTDAGSTFDVTGWKGIFAVVDYDGIPVSRDNSYCYRRIPPQNMVGTIIDRREAGTMHDYNFMYDVKWSKGGKMFNYSPSELTPK